MAARNGPICTLVYSNDLGQTVYKQQLALISLTTGLCRRAYLALLFREWNSKEYLLLSKGDKMYSMNRTSAQFRSGSFDAVHSSDHRRIDAHNISAAYFKALKSKVCITNHWRGISGFILPLKRTIENLLVQLYENLQQATTLSSRQEHNPCSASSICSQRVIRQLRSCSELGRNNALSITTLSLLLPWHTQKYPSYESEREISLNTRKSNQVCAFSHGKDSSLFSEWKCRFLISSGSSDPILRCISS